MLSARVLSVRRLFQRVILYFFFLFVPSRLFHFYICIVPLFRKQVNGHALTPVMVMLPLASRSSPVLTLYNTPTNVYFFVVFFLPENAYKRQSGCCFASRLPGGHTRPHVVTDFRRSDYLLDTSDTIPSYLSLK